MKIEEAKRMYGDRMYERMIPYLAGCTMSLDDEGRTDIPEDDLKRAYDLATKGRSDIEWD